MKKIYGFFIGYFREIRKNVGNPEINIVLCERSGKGDDIQRNSANVYFLYIAIIIEYFNFFQ